MAEGVRVTCIPHKRTPSDAEVLASHLAICRFLFSSEASSPCCRVPIFRSKTHGRWNFDATFSSIRKTVDNKQNSVNVTAQPAAESMGVVKQQTPVTGIDRPREL